jgi:hypothetical protein
VIARFSVVKSRYQAGAFHDTRSAGWGSPLTAEGKMTELTTVEGVAGDTHERWGARHGSSTIHFTITAMGAGTHRDSVFPSCRRGQAAARLTD